MSAVYSVHFPWLFSAVILLLAVWSLHGFLPALIWAVIVAMASWPLYEHFRLWLRLRGREHWAAPLFTLLVALLVIIPLFYAFMLLIREAHVLGQALVAAEKNGLPPPLWLGRLPLIGTYSRSWWQEVLGTPGGLGVLLGQVNSSALAHWTEVLSAQMLYRIMLLVLMLFTLFFTYRDGSYLEERLRHLAYSSLGERGIRYLEHTVKVVRATVNGVVLVALGEGVVMGMAYTLARIHAPFVWGLATGVLAMIPLGGRLVFVIATLTLMAQGNSGGAVLVVCCGLVVWFLADHVFRPMLIGSSARLPFFWVLLGMLGGIETFGLLGLFLGPVLMALTITLWEEWTGMDKPVANSPEALPGDDDVK